MKKFISFLAVAVACAGCFAGTLHIRIPSTSQSVFKEVTYNCVYERSSGNLVWFKKPGGGFILVGPSQEWWYEE